VLNVAVCRQDAPNVRYWVLGSVQSQPLLVASSCGSNGSLLPSAPRPARRSVLRIRRENIFAVATTRLARAAAAVGLVVLLLFGMFVIGWGVTFLVWSTLPDEFGFQGLWLGLGIICLYVGVPLGFLAVVGFRRLVSAVRGDRRAAVGRRRSLSGSSM
jgi:hypothetical protein